MKTIFSVLLVLPVWCFSQTKSQADTVLLFSKRIIGRWQSLEDKKAFVIVGKKTLRFEYIGESREKEEVYKIEYHRQANPGDLPDGLMFTSGKANKMGWYLQNVDAKNLVLVYTTRDSALKYRRVK